MIQGKISAMIGTTSFMIDRSCCAALIYNPQESRNQYKIREIGFVIIPNIMSQFEVVYGDVFNIEYILFTLKRH